MEELLEPCTSNDDTDDRPPWRGPLLDVAIGAEDVWAYIFEGRTNPDWDGPPTVPRLAVLMIRTAFQMLLWCYPDGPVAEAVNVAADLPKKLERLIGEELNSLLGEVY